jgi:hypothetical protein
VSSPAVPWQQVLTVEILQLHAPRSSCHSHPWKTQLNCQLKCSTISSLPCRLQPTGCLSSPLFNPLAWTAETTPYVLHCLCNHCRRNMFTELLPRNRSDITVRLTIIA